MDADEWLRHLDHRQACVRPILSSIEELSADGSGWVDTGTILHPLPTLPVWAHVFRDPMQGPLRRLRWHAPAWDAGAGGSALVPVSCANTASGDEVSLQEHSVRDELISY